VYVDRELPERPSLYEREQPNLRDVRAGLRRRWHGRVYRVQRRDLRQQRRLC
jgi:hypothetical protein